MPTPTPSQTDAHLVIVGRTQVLPDTVWDLIEDIDLSKPHFRSAPAGSASSVEIDGLTLLATDTQPRRVAYFGDWIAWDTAGHLSVLKAEAS